VRGILNLVGNKWSVLVVKVLNDRPLRFNELSRRVEGISQRMLTLTLRGLERDGLITRTVEPTVPPRVHYELSPLGRTLLEPVCALAAWAYRNYPQVLRNQQKFDRSQENRTVGTLR
jgi:DNA-binding HxlR family transcriptional regulator